MIIIIISASILAADFSDLKSEILRITDKGIEQLHFDVMDGIFVDNISFGIPVLQSIRKITDMVLDVHLMIQNPLKYISSFAKAGADIITFHYESDSDIQQTIDAIKSFNLKAGLSIRPNTPPEVILPYLSQLDNVLIMTVEPGFGGQSFMTDTMPKLNVIRKAIDDNKYTCTLQVDGGINGKTAPIAIKNGADNLVSGSYIFNSDNIEATVSTLLNA